MRAYHAGPKAAASPEAALYWLRFCKARLLLEMRQAALAQRAACGWRAGRGASAPDPDAQLPGSWMMHVLAQGAGRGRAAGGG